MTKDDEIEQIILRTIMQQGSEAIPQNYEFLQKYNLKEVYFHSIDLSMSGISLDLKKDLANMLRNFIVDPQFEYLKNLYKRCGKTAVMSELYHNELYYRTFLKCIKDGK